MKGEAEVWELKEDNAMVSIVEGTFVLWFTDTT